MIPLGPTLIDAALIFHYSDDILILFPFLTSTTACSSWNKLETHISEFFALTALPARSAWKVLPANNCMTCSLTSFSFATLKVNFS